MIQSILSIYAEHAALLATIFSNTSCLMHPVVLDDGNRILLNDGLPNRRPDQERASQKNFGRIKVTRSQPSRPVHSSESSALQIVFSRGEQAPHVSPRHFGCPLSLRLELPSILILNANLTRLCPHSMLFHE